MLLSFFENIEIHNIVNLVIACFVLSYVIRKKFSKDSELGFYDKIMLVLIIIILIEGIIINYSFYNTKIFIADYPLTALIINNLYILIALFALWIFYFKKNKRKKYSINPNSVIIIVLALFLLLFVYFIIKGLPSISFIRKLINAYPLFEFKFKVLLWLIAFFSTLAISLFLIIIISRFVRGLVFERNNKYRKHLQELFGNYIFAEENLRKGTSNKVLSFIKNNKVKKQIAIEELIKLKKNISGDLSSGITDLFFLLNLDTFSHKKLKHRKWYIRAQGIREISEMNLSSFKDEIKKLLNEKNDILKSEAIFAVSNLFGNKTPVCFLANYEQELTLWEQINIIYNSVNKKQVISNLGAVIKSYNQSVVLFALKLVGINKLNNYYNDVLNIIKNDPSEVVRREAIIALRSLDISKDLDVLIDIFFNETYDNKIEILKVLKAIPQNSYISFLKNIIENTDDYYIRLGACKAFEAIGTPYNMYLRILTETNNELRPYALHAMDKRI